MPPAPYTLSFKPAPVITTGASKEGTAGAPKDPVTIYVSRIAYKASVVLPTINGEISDLSYDITPDGLVEIDGIITAGEVKSTSASSASNKRARRISPPAPFAIAFRFPGSVDPKHSNHNLHQGRGVLDIMILKSGVVKKDETEAESESASGSRV